MNLIQVQEQLKDLPSGPQTMQALMSYANGSNPQVPPYLALGELNRRKQLMERAQMDAAGQQAQSAQGTVKDQVAQSAGLMALQQQRQQQAMQQMARGAMQQQAAVPGAIAQQGPVQAARGGLLNRLISYPAARYRSGGVIAFQSGTEGTVGNEEDRQNEEEERRREEMIRRMAEAQDAGYGAEDGSAKALLMRAMQERARRSEQRPQFVDPLAEREKIIRERPELAAATADTSVEMMRRLDEMDALRRAEFAKQREELAKSRPGILQLLGQAAAGTRGQRGASALAATLGGYADLSQRQDVAAMEQERGLRGRELELQQARMQVLNKIDEEKRARARGDVDLVMKARADHERILRDYDTSDNQLFGRELTALGQLASTEERQRGLEAREGIRQEGQTGRTEMAQQAQTERKQMEIAARERNNREAIAGRQRVQEMIASRPSGTTADVGRINAQRKIINDQIRLEEKVLDIKNVEATDQQKDDARASLNKLRQQLRELGEQQAGKATTAPTTSAKTMTMADVRATAQSSGRTEQQVINAAKAAGYTIK